MSALAARHAAGLLCVGFHGQSVSPELRELVRRGVRSVILFSRNVGEPQQVFELTRSIKRLCDEPITIAVDQEGGPVRRLRQGFTELPEMRALGNSGDSQLAFELGALLARELRAVGIDWDFAPVLDVDSNPANPVIGRRAFGREPELVARLGAALARGLQENGVAACGKHFPGHGDTTLDSHLALPSLPHDLARLEAVELPPFRAAVAADIASLMTAHVVFTPLDRARPATLSRAVLHGLLRERLGYRGVVVSDDLEMRAIVDHFGVDEAIVQGIAAGADAFLVCHSHERMHQAIDAVLRAAEQGALSAEQILSAYQRFSDFRRRWTQAPAARHDAAPLRCAAHRALAERLAAFAEHGEMRDPTERSG